VIFETALGRLLYDPGGDALWIDHGPIRGECRPSEGRTRLTFHAPDGQLSSLLWWLSHSLFTLTLVESLKRRGYYGMHAAGVVREGRGCLFVGASRSGKSTLALALARKGWEYLGDDTLFLRPVPEAGGTTPRGERLLPSGAGERLIPSGALEAVGFPETADITERTADYFPELRSHAEKPPAPHSHAEGPPAWSGSKRPLDVAKAYGCETQRADGGAPPGSCRPAAVVFPRIGERESSRIAPMSASEAQRRLLPLVLLTEKRATQSHLDALMRLAAECPCFEMETGRDFDALPERMERLLRALPPRDPGAASGGRS
jgi:hypothetical protein